MPMVDSLARLLDLSQRSPAMTRPVEVIRCGWSDLTVTAIHIPAAGGEHRPPDSVTFKSKCCTTKVIHPAPGTAFVIKLGELIEDATEVKHRPYIVSPCSRINA